MHEDNERKCMQNYDIRNLKKEFNLINAVL
jgi:hypothetical protein